jgi:hypothetical protein
MDAEVIAGLVQLEHRVHLGNVIEQKTVTFVAYEKSCTYIICLLVPYCPV